MLEQLESSYDCANAGEDLQQLKHELAELGEGDSPEAVEQRNRVENQIRFIQNKCSIH